MVLEMTLSLLIKMLILLKNPKKMFFVDIKNFIMSKNEVKKEITNWLYFYSNNDTDLVVNF